MSRSTIRRGKALGLTATAALALSVIPVGGAQAAKATPSSCTITGYTPVSVGVGLATVTKYFDVKSTGCTVLNWQINFGGGLVISTATPGLYFSSKDLVDADAGAIPITLKVKSTVAGEVTATKPATFSLLRVAQWGATFNATPEPVKKGAQITLTGSLKRIVWGKKAAYAPYKPSRKIQVQFKAAGTTAWVTIKSVASKTPKVKTTVPAVRTGLWRFHFGGNAITTPANSTTDSVAVTK